MIGLCLTAALGFFFLSPSTPAFDDETEGETHPWQQHARTPFDVSLEITEGTRLLGAGMDYAEILFPRLAKSHPGRFSYDEDNEIWSDAKDEYEWDDDEEMYWQNVSAETLTAGRQNFLQYCASCHGLDGEGYGRAARALRPPPRDFTQGIFKFTKVHPDYLPSDDALVALVQRGLDGTPMYPWDVHENQIRNIIQYIKFLSPEDEAWRDPYNDLADPIEIGDDPWTSQGEAIAEGELQYHKNQCYTCHPGYVSLSDLNALRGMDPATTYRSDIRYSKRVVDSSYKVLGNPVDIVPPDFTWDTMRAGSTPREIAQTIKAGIPGAGMPTWETFPDETIWAVAHYIHSITTTYRDDPEGRARFMSTLRKDDP